MEEFPLVHLFTFYMPLFVNLCKITKKAIKKQVIPFNTAFTYLPYVHLKLPKILEKFVRKRHLVGASQVVKLSMRVVGGESRA